LGGGLVGLGPGQQFGQVGGGELPVERSGGGVVAVDEGEQGLGEFGCVGEVVGGDDFLLDDREEDYL
jgi:hypothetical protein